MENKINGQTITPVNNETTLLEKTPTRDIPTIEKFRKDLEIEFPMIEAVRKHELKKIQHSCSFE